MTEKCQAAMVFGNDCGSKDNCTTFHCKLSAGHIGLHTVIGDVKCGLLPLSYILTWESSQQKQEKAK